MKRTKKVMQTDPRHGSEEKGFLKKQSSRGDRRAAKKDPEEASKKRKYKGYAS